MQNKSIVIAGDKSKYGLILGRNGHYLKSLKNKYSNKINIKIPLKNDQSNLITIEGQHAIEALFDIIKIIKPNHNE